MKIAVVLAVLAAVVSSTAVAATTKARVAVASTAPVTIAGSGFRARERVTVTLVTAAVHRKIVTAGARGAFRARYAGVTVKDCVSYFVRAKGNLGSLAVVKVMPECAPTGPPG